MNPLTQFKKISIPPLLIAQALVALTALIVVPAVLGESLLPLASVIPPAVSPHSCALYEGGRLLGPSRTSTFLRNE
jgi:hypothetical protein